MTMRSLALPYDQIDNHGRDGAASLRFGGMGCRGYRPGRKSGDRRVSSSLAAVSQLGRPSPQRVGRFFASTGELIEFEALRRAGIGAGIAAQVAAQFVTPQGQVAAADPLHHVLQDTADAAKVVHRLRSSIRLLDSLDANEIGLTHEAEPLSPRGKIHV